MGYLSRLKTRLARFDASISFMLLILLTVLFALTINL